MRAAAVAAVTLLTALGVASAGDEIHATRADLARAFLRFERAYRDHPPEDGVRLADVNKSFDGLTRTFFVGRVLGRYEGIVKRLDELTARLEGTTDEDVLFARSLKVAVDPPILPAGAAAKVKLVWATMYEAKGAEYPSPELTLRILDPAGGTRFERAVLQPRGAMWAKLGERLEPGAYPVRIAGVEVGRVLVLERSLDDLRSELEKRLAKVDAKTDEMEQALASCRARAGLVSAPPRDDRLISLLIDPVAHAAVVENEVAVLLAGRNPYRGRIGETWRVLAIDGGEVPLTVYAPEAAKGEKPLPLVIALHGMGGNESMFLHAYGAGRLRELADERGFLVATPTTEKFTDAAFDLLCEVLGREYRIDIERVCLLGHSMGAVRTSRLCGSRKERIAAACMIAGHGSPPADRPSTLEIWGENDPIMRPQPAKSDLLHPRRIVPNQGHTLVVGAVLPEALTWLLAHRLQPR